MALTEQQKLTLGTALLTSQDPTVVAALATSDDNTITNWCNTASGASAGPLGGQKAWRSLEPQDVDEVTPWTAFDALTAGQRDSWKQFLAYTRNFARNAIRQWVTDIWGASTAANSNSYKILNPAAQVMTNVEAILNAGAPARSTGTGAGQITAYALSWTGTVTPFEVGDALNKAGRTAR